jgi:hypothetical protein
MNDANHRPTVIAAVLLALIAFYCGLRAKSLWQDWQRRRK